MKIKHDGEYFENMIQSLKEVHEDIEDLDFKISDMVQRISEIEVLGASEVFVNAIEDLEDKLLGNFKEDLEDFIQNIVEGNTEMFEIEDAIKSKMDGEK